MKFSISPFVEMLTRSETEKDFVPPETGEAVGHAKIIVALTLACFGVAVAEVLIFSVLPGAILFAVLLVGLVNLAYFSRDSANRALYLALSLLPLARVLSLVLPTFPEVPFLGLIVIGIPLTCAAGIAAHVIGLPSLSLQIGWKKWAWQALFGLVGILLGVAAHFLLRPTLAGSDRSWIWLAAGLVSQVIFSGFLDELVFRGVLLQALSDRFGSTGVYLSSIFYAAMFVGKQPPGIVVIFGLTGMLFAFWVKKHGSLWGVIAAHGLINITIWLVPLIIT